MATTATNPENSATLTALDTLAVRLAALEAAHAREVAVLRGELTALRGGPAPRVAGASGRRGRLSARLGPTRANQAPAAAATERAPTSRRRLLGLGAKAAVAAAAAGVLAEQVGTRAAYADNLGNFSSSVFLTPAVTATGTNGGYGVQATSDSNVGISATSTSGYGISANSDSNYGVYATSNSGNGLLVSSQTGNGIMVYSGGTYAIDADNTIFAGATGDGVIGSTSGASTSGIHGINRSNAGGSVAVLGHSDDGSSNLGPGIGVQGETAGGQGVRGTATTGSGVYGLSTSGTGVIGVSTSGDAVGGLSASGNALYGLSAGGDGAYGQTGASAAYGLHGVNTSNSTSSIAVLGHSDDGAGNLGPGIGVQGETAGGQGVRGTATTGVGVYGTSAGGARTQALYGVGTSGTTGLRATSDSGNGIVATSTSGTGLNVQSSTGSAVVATSNGVGYGLYLTAPSGWAIGCVGRIRVIGAAVGTVTLAHGTTTKTVSSTACSGGSQVILTPTTNPGVFIWAVAAPGAFTIHASSAPSSDVTFSYLLIN